MNRIPNSAAVRSAGLVAASVGLCGWLYSAMPPFTAYRDLFPWPVIGSFNAGGLGLGLFLFGAVAASWSALADADRLAKTWVHRLDYFFVLIALLLGWTLVAGFFEHGRHVLVWHLICLTVLAVSGAYLWITTLVRLRAGTLGDTIFWPRVFHTLPLRQFSGVFVLVVVSLASLLVVVGAGAATSEAMGSNDWNPLSLGRWLSNYWFPGVALPAVILVVTAVLCRDLIAITAARERAVEAQLSEQRFRAELITNVTHDLRTPLTSIVTYAGLIDQLDLPDPTLKEYSGVLQRKAERLRVLIGDLLEASRVSAGAVPVRLEPIELTEIIGQVAGDFDAALAARELDWVTPPTEPWVVRTDGAHLWRILENLVGNVIKYARPGSAVRAEVIALPGAAGIRLTNRMDQPLTVAPGELTAQFVRGDLARQGEGSGLGLFIADGLARRMGAELRIEVLGEEFVATVVLPTLLPVVSEAAPGRTIRSARAAQLAVASD